MAVPFLEIREFSGNLLSTSGKFGKCQNVREISGDFALGVADFSAEHVKNDVIWIFLCTCRFLIRGRERMRGREGERGKSR